VAVGGPALSATLEQAVSFAREQGQLALWDRSPRPYAIALYDENRRLRPLTDEEAATLLNRDSLIRKHWSKWNAMTGNEGSLVVIDTERALRILAAATEGPDSDDEVKGLA
jgi:hypothetical protein